MKENWTGLKLGGEPEWDKQTGVLAQANELDQGDLAEPSWLEWVGEAGWSDQVGAAQAIQASEVGWTGLDS